MIASAINAGVHIYSVMALHFSATAVITLLLLYLYIKTEKELQSSVFNGRLFTGVILSCVTFTLVIVFGVARAVEAFQLSSVAGTLALFSGVIALSIFSSSEKKNATLPVKFINSGKVAEMQIGESKDVHVLFLDYYNGNLYIRKDHNELIHLKDSRRVILYRASTDHWNVYLSEDCDYKWIPKESLELDNYIQIHKIFTT